MKAFFPAERKLLEPGALPPVPVRVPADEWDNLIRKWGIGFACEWFGHHYDSHETALTLQCLQERNAASIAGASP